jgi:hypothetical protein
MAIFPAEGKLVHVSEQDAANIIGITFFGKTPPDAKTPRAIIMHGPPGAGKTTEAYAQYADLTPDRRANTIFVAYDEHGALYAIPEYRDVIRKSMSFQDRHDLWAKFREDSQLIRTEIIETAFAERFDVIIDVTSSGKFAGKFVELIKAQGYDTEVISVLAPFDLCAERFLSRERPGSPRELISKRIGAAEMLPTLAQTADTFTLRFNPHENTLTSVFRPESNRSLPVLTTRTRGDQKLSLVLNQAAFDAVLDTYANDAAALSPQVALSSGEVIALPLEDGDAGALANAGQGAISFLQGLNTARLG